MLALTILMMLPAVAIFAPWLAPHDPDAQNLLLRYGAPSPDFPLGTDRFGRDTLSRLIFGLRPTLIVAGGSVTAAAVVGTALGMFAGYRRGWFDQVVTRGVDLLMSFPVLLLALIVVAAFGSSVTNVLIAIAIAFIPTFVRLARNPTLSIRRSEYIEAARSVGAGDNRIVLRHILPNVRPAIITYGIIAVADAAILESGLTFLGVGLQPPQASLGSMIRESFTDLSQGTWLAISSGGVLFALVFCLNTVGDRLQSMIAHRPR